MTQQAGYRITDGFAKTCGVLAATLGFVALAGWILGIPVLSTLGPGWLPMAPSSALLFILLGGTIFFVARKPPQPTASRIGIALGLAATLIALLLFILSYRGIYLDAEHLGFAISGTIGAAPIGHMSPVTALSFMLAGLSLVAVMASPPDRSEWAITSFCLAGLMTLNGIVLLLSYYFGTPLFYGGKMIPPALTTSIGLTVLGAALLALSGPRGWAPGQQISAETLRASIPFWLIFLLMAVGLIKVGGLYYDQDVKQNRATIERELSGIADLKVGELVKWREERLSNATVLYGNYAFADLVRRSLGSTRDAAAREQLYLWLQQIRKAYGYTEIHLIDAQGVARLSIPDDSPNAGEIEAARQALRSGQVSLDDFHHDKAGDAAHLTLWVPILDAAVGGRPLAIVMLEIDPSRDLFPIIDRWPTFSPSAETLLVRRDGDDVLYLNELKYRKNTTLALRYPLTRIEKTAVMAVLGQEGIVEGTDYRDVPVIAALRAVPGTPWFLVARMNRDEYLAAIQESLWLTSGLVTALLLSTAAALGLIWRHQRVNHYKERARDAEALARMTHLYAALSQCNEAIVRSDSEEELFPTICRVAVQFGGMKLAWIGIIETESRRVRPVASFGYGSNDLVDISIPLDADSQFGNGPTGIALRENRPVWCQDFQNAASTLPWREIAASGDIAASASLPLHRAGVVIGALILYSASVNAFDEQVRKLLVEMVTDIDFALDNFDREAVRSHTEERLRIAEEKLLLGIEQFMFGVIDWDKDFRVVSWNPAAERIFGYTPEEAIGHHASFLLPASAKGLADMLWSKLMSGQGDIHSAGKNITKDGRTIICNWNINRLTRHDGTMFGVSSMVEDITERKQAEQKLAESEARFRGLVEQEIAGSYIVQDGKLAYVNPRFAEIFGYDSAAEIIGREFLPLIAEKDRGIVAENIRKRIEGEVINVAYEFTALRKDGSMVEIGVNGTRAIHNGRPAVIGLIQDISEKKRADADIRRYVEQLKTSFMSTVKVTTTLSEMRDPYTTGHERRVAEIAVAIGVELGFDEARLEGLSVAGHLHDIGKINIPAEILSKPGKLSTIEYQLVQGHSQAGYDVLKTVEFPWPVAQVALQHHERIDGSGYPQGLKGEEILLEARIMAVADVVEAMSSHRPYRPGLGIETALAEIERGRGSAYDTAVADACLRLFRKKGCQLPI